MARTDLRRPEIEVAQRGQLDEIARAVVGDLREGEAQALEVAERARAEHARQVGVRRLGRQRQLPRTAFLLL